MRNFWEAFFLYIYLEKNRKVSSRCTLVTLTVCGLGKATGGGFSVTTSNVVMPKLCQNQIEKEKKHLENCSNLKHSILVQVQGDSRSVVIFINSYNIEFQQKKKEQIALCPWHDNLPFTVCIFIYQFEKQRTKTINNRCSIQSVWYMNSVSMQIIIPGLFMRTAGKAGSLLCKNRQKMYDQNVWIQSHI